MRSCFMLQISKVKCKDFMDAFKGKESITQDELQKVVEKKNYIIFEGEVILHLLEGVILIPMNGNDILTQNVRMTTDKHIEDKRDFVEQYEEKMRVYEYVLQNQTNIFQMDVEEKVTFDEFKTWYDDSFKTPGCLMDWELEEYRYEDGVYFDLQHIEDFREGHTYFFIQDGVVEMRYSVENDTKYYEWNPILLEEKHIPHLEKRLEEESSKEGVQILTYILEYVKNKSK